MRTSTKSRFELPFIEPALLGRPRWKRTNPIRGGEAEEIYEALRDILIQIPSQALTQQNAFQIPFGASYTPPGGTAYNKTRWDTNMMKAGELPGPDRYQVEAVSVQLQPSVHPADAQAWAQQSLVTLHIGGTDKRYVEDVPMFIPGGSSIHTSGYMDLATAADTFLLNTSNGWPVARNVRVLGEDSSSGAQVIEQGQNFYIEEDPTQDKYDAAYTTKATTTKPPGTGIKAFYHLFGHWDRGVQ